VPVVSLQLLSLTTARENFRQQEAKGNALMYSVSLKWVGEIQKNDPKQPANIYLFLFKFEIWNFRLRLRFRSEKHRHTWQSPHQSFI